MAVEVWSVAYSPFERVFESSELMFYAMLEVQPHELHFICTCSFFGPRTCPFRCLFNLQIARGGSRCCSRELVSFGSFEAIPGANASWRAWPRLLQKQKYRAMAVEVWSVAYSPFERVFESSELMFYAMQSFSFSLLVVFGCVFLICFEYLNSNMPVSKKQGRLLRQWPIYIYIYMCVCTCTCICVCTHPRMNAHLCICISNMLKHKPTT